MNPWSNGPLPHHDKSNVNPKPEPHAVLSIQGAKGQEVGGDIELTLLGGPELVEVTYPLG